MKSVQSLPEGYSEIYNVNLQKNKKTALLINSVGLLISLILAVPMDFVVPMSTLFSMDNGFAAYYIRFGALIALYVLYIVLHEAVHGIAMKMCGTQKIKYGFTGLYAFAGSDDYYDKKSYIFIALAPVILWGVVLAVINIFVPQDWFWVVYIIQIGNLSGAAGDLFVTIKFSRFPKDILVKDYGVGMHVFSKTKN